MWLAIAPTGCVRPPARGYGRQSERGLLLDCVLSAPYVDAAPVGTHEPRSADPNNEIPDDVASRIDLAKLYER